MKKALILLILLLLCGCGQTVSVQKRKIAEGSGTAAARLTLISYDGKDECSYLIQSYGHSFLMLQNTSETPLPLTGDAVLAPGESVTFGWWAIDRHLGLWFNVESEYIHKAGRYGERVSVSADLSEEQLTRLRAFLEKNDSYSPLGNCAKKAAACWNEVLPENAIILGFFATPGELCAELKRFESAQEKCPVPDCGKAFFLLNGTRTAFEMTVMP